MKEYWVRNTTTNDIILHDLRLTVPSNQTVNLLKRRPSLTMDQIEKSKADGKLRVCFSCSPPKLIELPMAPPTFKAAESDIKESMLPIPSRVKTSVIVNAKEKDYVEVMEEENMKLSDISASKYADYVDGIVDPISIDSDNSTFKVISVQEKIDKIVLAPQSVTTQASMNGKVRQVGKGKNKVLTIDAPK